MAVIDREHLPAFEAARPSIVKARDAVPARADRQVLHDEALRLVQQVFLTHAAPPRVVVFAGIDGGSGCSQIAASTAEALARHSRRPVCLVDGNLRSPKIAHLFSRPNHVGFTDSLDRGGPIRSFGADVAAENLWILPSGPVTAESASLLNSARLRDRIEELRREFEYVCIDAPPLTHYSDAVALAQLAEGVVLVLEADTTRRDAASAVASSLQAAHVTVLAAVLNKRTFPIPEALYKRL